MIIRTYLDGKYEVFYHIIDLVGTATEVQTLACKEAAYMQTLYNRATTYYNLIPISNSYLE